MEQSSPQGLPDTGQTAATNFSKFRCLPAEVRFMIWECAMDEHHQVISGGRARKPKPTALLWTNAESRYLALKRGGHIIVVKKIPLVSSSSSCPAAASDTSSFHTIQESRYEEYDFHLYCSPNITNNSFRESLRCVPKTCIMKQNRFRSLVLGLEIWCCTFDNHRCNDYRCFLFDRMSTILIHPCDPCDPYTLRQDLERGVVEVDPRGLKAATRGLFGYDNHLIVNLLDPAQVGRAIGILSADEATKAIGAKILMVSNEIHTYTFYNGRFTWWEIMVSAAQRMWLCFNYRRLSEDERAGLSYNPCTWTSYPEPYDWDQDDPWVKGILERLPVLLPAVVLVLQA
ncbi:hypothetical protein PFICI_08034 [Pestalotiopsis fici W106-1]|uniref:2EXR domain-containing protein n=1 Tax=Pestalotiopsis fici (strain W106-1 / CGMCC3.15140) TaxID=1229662 RepID=W3X348_PESFW|nr:uncharacterized protein PFICI_08034 [Pestalotiopsis fici W106-1]ETS80505.1 hypothetical protein PFICI_08034 [Pestalotiopsis fici W106-1]